MNDAREIYRSAARARKAALLTDAIIVKFPEVELEALADVANQLSDSWWAEMAMVAGVAPPSAATIAVVQTLIRHRAEADNQSDPFSGLPS